MIYSRTCLELGTSQKQTPELVRELTVVPSGIALDRKNHPEPEMPTHNVCLTGYFDRFVESQVASGRYKDVSEVMRAGLRLLEQHSREDQEKLAILRDLAADAFEAIDRGEGIAIEGEEELAEFIRGIGRRASRPVRRPAGA